MDYFDTSFLTPLIREEKTSSRIAHFMSRLQAGDFAISRWTEVEFASLLARDVRMGTLTSDQARAADALFEDVIGESFVVLVPAADDYDRARRYLQHYEIGLRAGNALHLSIAANHGARTIYSLDKTMIKAGRMLGLTMSAGIRAD